MTYRKIAQLAGVSLSTVSKALSGSSEISRDTTERIRKIAESCGTTRPKYRKNHTAKRVAIIVPEIISVHYSSMTSELVDELRGLGIEPSIYLCGFENKKYHEIIDMLCDDGITDGILTFSCTRYPHKIDIPMVRIGGDQPYADCDNVGNDSSAGIFEALEYLMALGHRNIGFIGEKYTNVKLNYFNCAAKQLGLKTLPQNMFISDKRFEAIGTEAAEYFMKLDVRPTALIAAYDEVAIGAIHTFTENGISIPNDISIIGINDIPSASYAAIPLTTLRTYNSEIIRLSVKMLMHHIDNPENHITQRVNVKCELIIRNTTAKIKNK
ncbi:MAG: LacI family transcriptional regulator [Clostridiales bacterium]|nr:LacI family transcriptional regulator [Clostridiales bacterium]